MKKMMNELHHLLNTMGLTISTTKTTIATNNTAWANQKMDTTDGQHTIHGPDHPIALLGTMLTLDGCITTEIKHRRKKALSAFWAQKEALTTKHATLRRRLQLFHTTVTTTLLWGAESWTTTRQQRDSLDVLHRWMVREMMTPKRRPNETWPEWHTRTLHAAKDVIQRHSTPWSMQIAKTKAEWATNLATKPTTDAVRRTVLWHSAAWRTQDAEQMGWRRYRRTTNAKWIRWEDSLAKQYGEDWHTHHTRLNREPHNL